MRKEVIKLKLYITRHGETEWNTLKKMQGWQNSNLTEKGIENAIRLGERLKDIDFNHIYSSPLGRAMDTANYIKGTRDIKIETHDGLKELGFGLWEGIENEEVIRLYGDEHYNFWNKPQLYKNNEGESFDELFKRVNGVLEYIIKNSTGDNILIVSHAITIKAIYYIIKNYDLENFWELPYIDGTSLTIVEIDGNKMEILLEGDTSHVK